MVSKNNCAKLVEKMGVYKENHFFIQIIRGWSCRDGKNLGGSSRYLPNFQRACTNASSGLWMRKGTVRCRNSGSGWKSASKMAT